MKKSVFLVIFCCSSGLLWGMEGQVEPFTYNNLIKLKDEKKNVPDFNKKDSNGNSPLHIAVFYADQVLTKYLIDKAEPLTEKDLLLAKNKQEDTPLHIAVQGNNAELVKLLLSIDDLDNDDKRAMLLEHNAKGLSCLHIAVRDGLAGMVDILLDTMPEAKKKRRLKKKVAKYIDSQTAKGSTPLYIAVVKKNLAMVKNLLQKGANVAIANNDGIMPFFKALKNIEFDQDTASDAHRIFNLLCITIFGALQQMIKDRQYKDFLKSMEHYRELDKNFITFVSKVRGDLGISLMHVIANQQSKDKEQIENSLGIMASYLFDQHFDMHTTIDSMGQTAMHHAVEAANLPFIKHLINKDISVINVLDRDVNGDGDGENNLLHTAIEKKRPAIIDYLIDIEGNLGLLLAKNNRGDTPLHVAINVNNLRIAKRLLKKTKSQLLDVPNNTRQTPLHRAVIQKNKELVKKLIQLGANIDATDNQHKTPKAYAQFGSKIHKMLATEEAKREKAEFKKTLEELVSAINKNDVSSVSSMLTAQQPSVRKALLTKKVKLDKKITGPLLLLATNKNNNKVIEALIDHDAPIDGTDSLGCTPLHRAVIANNTNLVKLFIANKADINLEDNEGNSPLMSAITGKREQIMELLLKNKAFLDIGAVLAGARTRVAKRRVLQVLYQVLLEELDNDSVQYLAQLQSYNKKNINTLAVLLDEQGNTLLHLAAQLKKPAFLNHLLRNATSTNFHANTVNNQGQTPLHVAANEEIAHMLLSYRADITISDNQSYDPLHSALFKKNKPLATYLFDLFAQRDKFGDVAFADKTNNNDTYLHLAARAGYLNICRDLINSQDRNNFATIVNLQNKQGDAPLHLAAQLDYDDEHANLIKYLMARAADLKLKNSAGNSPVDIAKHEKITEILSMGRFLLALDMLDVDYIKEHLKNKPSDINTKLYDGSYPLHWIVRQYDQKNDSKVHILVSSIFKQKKINLDNVNSQGQWILHLAAKIEDATILKKAFEYNEKAYTRSWIVGALANKADKKNNTPLHLAAASGSLACTQLLIDNLANKVAINKFGQTPLHLAVDHFDFVDITQPDEQRNYLQLLGLLKDGINEQTQVNVGFLGRIFAESRALKRKEQMQTPLHYFAQRSLLSAPTAEEAGVATYIDNIVVSSAKKQRLISYLQQYWEFQQQVLQKLLSFGPDLTIKDKRGNTALHYLAQHERDHEFYKYVTREINKENDPWSGRFRSLIRVLIDDKDLQKRYWNHYYKLFFGDNFSTGMLSDVEKPEELLNMVNEAGSTPVHYLAQHAHSYFVESSMAENADITIKSVEFNNKSVGDIFDGRFKRAPQASEEEEEVDAVDELADALVKLKGKLKVLLGRLVGNG